MSHLMSSLETIVESGDYERIERVGTGACVLYNVHQGRQRQGRSSFPALVLSQHPDDGSLDLLVFFEPEDLIWERRVRKWSEQQPGHSWQPVSDVPVDPEFVDHSLANRVEILAQALFGPFVEPPKSVMEYMNDFDERLTKLEKAMKGAKKGS